MSTPVSYQESFANTQKCLGLRSLRVLHNPPINHIAISCTDIEALVSWYTSILGFRLMGKIRHYSRRDDEDAFKYTFISYPEDMRELKFAILTSGNSVCIEVFQFIDPAPRPRDEGFEFRRVGIFHICVTDPNPGTLVKRIVENGGKQVGGVMDYSRYGLEGQSGVYTQDPWGNVVEVMSISLESLSAAGNALGWYIYTQKAKEKAQGPSL